MLANLNKLISEFDLEDHHDFLLKIAKPSIELVASDAKIKLACSKLGGYPDVPPEFEWPDHELGPYRFIGQINLADVPKGTDLPRSGLLSFFQAYDEDGESFWQDPGYVLAFHFADLGELKSAKPPEEVRLGSKCAVKLMLSADVPPWPWDNAALKKWPIDKGLSQAYSDMRLELHPSERWLLGYPFNNSLAYDPAPGPEWTSLLTLGSDDDMEWFWHDGDWLVSFIEVEKLRAGDFAEIKSDAG